MLVYILDYSLHTVVIHTTNTVYISCINIWSLLFIHICLYSALHSFLHLWLDTKLHYVVTVLVHCEMAFKLNLILSKFKAQRLNYRKMSLHILMIPHSTSKSCNQHQLNTLLNSWWSYHEDHLIALLGLLFIPHELSQQIGFVMELYMCKFAFFW